MVLKVTVKGNGTTTSVIAITAQQGKLAFFYVLDEFWNCKGAGLAIPATPVTPWPLPEKALRRRKAGRYSVKKSVLFERSEFTDFRNIAWLFSFWRFRA